MPPEPRFIVRFAAEPPQEGLPYGRWAEQLQAELLAACLRIDSEGDDLGQPGDITWFPDRTYGGRTYVPGTARTSTGFELFGHVSFARDEDGEPTDFAAAADYTGENAEANPDWQIDLCDEVVGTWRGEHGNAAAMTLVWGVPMVRDGAIATAELADLAVDQCTLIEGRFTLLAPDDYRGDTLDVKLFDVRGNELARESLYEDDDEDDEPE
jgi:hypothetical protein